MRLNSPFLPDCAIFWGRATAWPRAKQEVEASPRSLISVVPRLRARALLLVLSSPVFGDAPVGAFGLLGLGAIDLAALRDPVVIGAAPFPGFCDVTGREFEIAQFPGQEAAAPKRSPLPS